MRHAGIPLYHIIKHDTPFKIHNTHAFIYTNHTITRYLEDFSNLHPIQMYKKVKGHFKILGQILDFGLNFEFSIYTHPPKVFIYPKSKMGKWKKGNNFGKMTRLILIPKILFQLSKPKGT